MLSFDFDPGRPLDDYLAAVPDGPAVFLAWPRPDDAQARPYLSKTSFHRRRLRRAKPGPGAGAGG